jgi:hypothetical protein
MKRNRFNPGLSSLAFTLAALCGMGSASMPQFTNAASVAHASRAAKAQETAVRRQSPQLLRGSLHKTSGMFAHSYLNQRQRRKFNRQRWAAGDKKAFA